MNVDECSWMLMNVDECSWMLVNVDECWVYEWFMMTWDGDYISDFSGSMVRGRLELGIEFPVSTW